jgi:hypothetical protein
MTCPGSGLRAELSEKHRQLRIQRRASHNGDVVGPHHACWAAQHRTSLAGHQATRGAIPRGETVLLVAIEPTTGDVAQVERC